MRYVMLYRTRNYEMRRRNRFASILSASESTVCALLAVFVKYPILPVVAYICNLAQTYGMTNLAQSSTIKSCSWKCWQIIITMLLWLCITTACKFLSFYYVVVHRIIWLLLLISMCEATEEGQNIVWLHRIIWLLLWFQCVKPLRRDRVLYGRTESFSNRFNIFMSPSYVSIIR